MKKIITYGTYDLFHYGHIRFLQRAKALGDYLVVAVSSDEFTRLKNKECIIPYKERAAIVSAIKYVYKVIKEEYWEQKEKDIIENNIDIFVMGDDWKGRFDFLKSFCEVKYLSRTPGISTSMMKDTLSKRIINV